MLSNPARAICSTRPGRLPLVLQFRVPRSVAARIRRIASAITSAWRSGSPSQPWPKLAMASGTLVRNGRATSTTSSALGAYRMRS